MNRLLLSLTILGCLAPQVAFADLYARCTEDQLSAAQVKGRNAWAVKCGFIDTDEEEFYNFKSLYVVFNKGSWTGNPAPVIPIDPTKPCVAGIWAIGNCKAGCYTPTQELVFGGEQMSIERGYLSGQPTITALTADSTPDNLAFGEQTIDAFIAGETQEDIYILHGDGGQRLEVTAHHPMVLMDGALIAADSVKPKDVLLGADGEPIVLAAVEKVPFSGTVWNLEPESTDKKENILIAEGFLTGSVRFQNEWAADVYRLTRRDKIRLPERLARP